MNELIFLSNLLNFFVEIMPSYVSMSAEQAAELTAPINTIGVDEADAVFSQLVSEVQEAASSFEQRTQAVLSKVNVSERNLTSAGTLSCLSLIRDLNPSSNWSNFTYNCACKTAVPIYRVQPCDRPALLQITDFLATGDSYLAFANDQLILKTPQRRNLGILTQSFDPSSAMLSHDWSHGEVPIEQRTTFTLKITPRNVTYETGRGAVRLLPLNHTSISSRLFVITNDLPFEQAKDACAAFESTLAILNNERQIKEVAIALNKLPGCPSIWFGGVECRKAVSRLYMLFNPVTETAVIDRAPRYDSTLRNVLCLRNKRN
jgi:hypothetical protein